MSNVPTKTDEGQRISEESTTNDNENVVPCEEVGNLYNYNSFSFDLLVT
jgi:hypothetical protein